MKWVLLRAAMAIVVTGGLYAVYLFATGGKVQFYLVVITVTVPLILTAHRIVRSDYVR
jgi:hypothetical protein